MYQALYRKWRPATLDDVVSQPHITTTLRNQISSGKTAHAYLFTGSRGTGKTTCARIFAKAINCLSPKDGSPCMECEICKRFDSETLSDIVEIDAASNTGVDDMREIRESTAYTPEVCRYKVYIIDEVHMLSVSAFNALLKILEEPPEYVKFILATTEIHKVPVTIVSRCQRFDFRRILPEDIKSRLLYIADNEDFTLDGEAAELIAKLADGGMRDALSLLDQCIAYSRDVTVDTVSAAAGIAGRDHLFSLLECFAERDAVTAINIIGELYDASKDMQRLVDELISQMRNVMLARSVKSNDAFVCLPDEIAIIRKIADKLDIGRILEMLDILQQCSERLPRVAAKRVEIEMCVVRLCSSEQKQGNVPAVADSAEIASLRGRIAALENMVKSISSGAVPKPKKAEPLVPQDHPPIPEPKVDISKLRPEDFKPLGEWNDILAELSQRDAATAGFLADSNAFVYENVMLLVVDNDFFLKMFKETKCAQTLSQILTERFGKAFVIRARSAKNADPSNSEDPVSKLLERAKSSDVAVDIKQ